jgi:hypothetical protein
MLKRLLSLFSRQPQAQPNASPSPGGVGQVAYRDAAINTVYNLLFCDEPSLFAPGPDETPAPWQSTLLDSAADAAAVQRLAADESQESRVRVLAYNWLLSRGHEVPPGLLLGVVVEAPMAKGLDALAAYQDGQVRYINQSGKLAVFDGAPADVRQAALELVEVSKAVVARIGPWEKPRLPPPQRGHVRLTFLVSDGIYFGEGPFDHMQKDPMAAPVLSKAAQLLKLSVDAALKPSKG